MPRSTTTAPTKKWDDAEVWPLARTKPYDKNTRTHPPEQVKLLARLLLKFGPDQPIVVSGDAPDFGVILKGHGRRLAAMEAQLPEFPVFVRRGLSDDEKRELRIADNQSALLSGWDDVLMREEIGLLKAAEMDLSLLGFSDTQLTKFMDSTPGRTEPDASPDLPDKPVVRHGDVWTLGRHRLMCGDSTKHTDVAALAGTDLCTLVFTDPPYGVAYRDTGAGSWDTEKLAKKKAGTLRPRFNAIENDDLDEVQLLEFLQGYMRVQPLTKTASQYICHANLRQHVFREALLATGAAIRAVCIWNKSRPGFNFAHYKWKHEPIYYAVPAKGKAAWYGDRTQTTIWDVPSESGAAYKHPTQKPVGLATIAIVNSSKAGDFVYEPFCGSGATIIACEMQGRRGMAMELDPRYVQVTIERWQNFTGLVAKLGDKDYASVATERRRDKPSVKAKGKRHAVRDSRKPVRKQAPGSARVPRPVAQSPVRAQVPSA